MTQVNPQTLTLSSLSHRCAQESDNFFNRQEHDPRFCYELFRRAVLQRNERAWACIYGQYQDLVSHWVRRHAAFGTSGEEAQFFMNRAFEKMWLGITPEKFDTFTDLKSLLRYLQMCVHSVIVDFVRQKEHKLILEATEEMVHPPATGETAVEEQIAAHFVRQEFWQWLKQQLNNEKERCVVQGMFVLALKPREVLTQYPKVFQDINEVYRAKENLLARLRRNSDTQDFGFDP